MLAHDLLTLYVEASFERINKDDVYARMHTHTHIFKRKCSRTQVLDDSGSMGSHWKDLVQAVKSFLGVRSGIGVQDRVSVVIYNSSARVFWDAKPLCECSREVDTLFNAFQSDPEALAML